MCISGRGTRAGEVNPNESAARVRVDGWGCRGKDPMSRIHDALKKAEQEKAAGHLPGGAASPGKAGPPGWLQSEGLSSRDGGGLRKPSRPVREDPVRATLLKALDERCRRSAWMPHTSMTLFVQWEESCTGHRGVSQFAFASLPSAHTTTGTQASDHQPLAQGGKDFYRGESVFRDGPAA